MLAEFVYFRLQTSAGLLRKYHETLDCSQDGKILNGWTTISFPKDTLMYVVNAADSFVYSILLWTESWGVMWNLQVTENLRSYMQSTEIFFMH